MRIFAMAASLRKASLNRKLIAAAAKAAEGEGASVDIADFGDFTLPLYNGDLSFDTPVHPAAHKLAERIAAADAVMIATPEYNYSIPGALKNAIDWLSRMKDNPFGQGKPLMLLATSPGSVGGARGLWHTRVPFEGIGAYVHPDMFYVPNGSTALEDDRLVDNKQSEALRKSVNGFLKAAAALNTREM
ncbi:MAG: NAD(P)H-dependent oxidoreductase [Myxococcota bacterium]